ncbi:MAG: leucine-rich repeat domain-containing protein [Ruminococcus sp.]|nr:leucine-rich repeat domain-containing protein [Ruminococcus sp.]
MIILKRSISLFLTLLLLISAAALPASVNATGENVLGDTPLTYQAYCPGYKTEHSYEFTASKDGLAVMYSVTNNLDTYGKLYHNGSLVATDDWNGDNGYDYKISYNLEQGETYQVVSVLYEDDPATFDVYIRYATNDDDYAWELRTDPDTGDETYYVSWYKADELWDQDIDEYFGRWGNAVIPETHDGIAVTGIGYSAFNSPNNYILIQSVTIPASVTVIESSAFNGESTLTEVNIPKNSKLKTIEEWAFYACGFESFTIPDGVTTVGKEAFEGSNSYSDNGLNLKSITVPASVTNIGERAFGYYYDSDDGMDKLVEGFIIYGYEGSKAEEYATANGITFVAIEEPETTEPETTQPAATEPEPSPDDWFSWDLYEDNETHDESYYVSYYDYEIYWQMPGADNPVIPSTHDGLAVTGISTWAFNVQQYIWIDSITIPESVEVIGNSAFGGQESLKNVIFLGNSKLKTIESMAFCGCGFDSFTIPDGVTTIEDEAFRDCENLKSITIPASVTNIGEAAFGYYWDWDADSNLKYDDFTIYGYTGTAAETYATNNGFTFIALQEQATTQPTTQPAVTSFSDFQYVNDRTENAFNPVVKLRGKFNGSDLATRKTVTDGDTVQASVYDNNADNIMDVEIGGDDSLYSAIYNRNLIYSIEDYTTGSTLAGFRIYKNELIPVNCTEAQLKNYIVTDNVTFTNSGNNSICTKVVLPFKNTENGLKLVYTATQAYAPVIIRQHVKDSNDAALTTTNDFTAAVSKYPSTMGGKYFTAQDPSSATSFSDGYTAAGAEDTHYMKLVNSTSAQGLEIKPIAPAGYVLASNPTVKTISPNGVENTDAELSFSDIGDNTYRISYTGDENNLSFMSGERIEIDITYVVTDLTYVPFSYTAAGNFKPRTIFRGTIVGNKNGYVEATNNLNTINTPYYDSDSQNPRCLTMEIGGDLTDNSTSIFHEANLVYTLNDKNTGSPLLKFRIYRGQIEPVDNYSQDTFNELIDYAAVESYKPTTNSGLMEKATIRLKLPIQGLSVIGYAEVPYLPVTVKQYVLDNDGEATAADEDFKTTITKFYNGNNDLGTHKYFNKEELTDTYGLGSASAAEDDFINSYEVTGESGSRYMVYLDAPQGMYLLPESPEGFDFATMEAKAFNPAGDEITNTSHTQSLLKVPTNYVKDKGYQITFSSGKYFRSASIEIAVYYRPTTTITLKQEMDGSLESSLLSKVTVTTTEAVASPFRAYTSAGTSLQNSVTIENYKGNMIEVDENHIGSLFRTTKLGAHKGVVPQIKVEPRGARNVSSVKIYKKNGNEYEELPSTDYTVTGDGDVNSYITYTFKNAIDFGDDYLVSVVYGRQQRLTVEAVLRNANGSETVVNTPDLYEQSGLDKITVAGQRYNVTGSDTEEKAFSEVSDSNIKKDSFEVTDTPVTVNSSTNTKVTIDTSFNENSEYVIANILAYNDLGSNLNLAVPGTKQVNGKTVTAYENSTLPSLSSSDNVTVKIILTKVAKVKVSVFTVLEDGTTVENGTPRGVNRSDAYINVAVRSNSINQKAIITEESEGAYYTGDFDITFDPHSRNVSVLEGSTLEVFAQLPGNGDYVISRITTNGNGYNNISISNVGKYNNDNLRETLNTGSTTLYSDKTYELNIYIQKARSIYTYVYKDEGDGVEGYGGGTVTMRGSHETAGSIPFTKLNPANESTPTHFNAVNGDSYYNRAYTVEAKAIRDTNLSFEVTPPSQYAIKNVSVKSGTSKATARDVKFTASAPDTNGKVTYTISEKMSPNSDLFVDVSYTILDGGYIAVDYQYTDDYEHYYNMFDPDNGISKMSASVRWTSYGVRQQVARNLVTGEEKFSWTNIQYSTSDIPDTIPEKLYKFYVAAGNHFEVDANAYINGKWYVGVENECYIYDADTNARISNLSSSSVGGSSTPVSAGYTMTTGKNVVFRVRLAPVGTVGSVAVDCNSYDDSPSNSTRQNSGSATINTTKPSVTQPYAIPHALGSGSNNRTNSSSSSSIEIAKDSKITSVDVYNSTVKPGNIRSVTLYEFDKSVVGSGGSSYENLKPKIDNQSYVKKWDLTLKGTYTENNNTYKRYIPENSIQVENDKSYRVVVMYDRIRVFNETGQSAYPENAYVKAYIYFGSDNPEDINISTLGGDTYNLLGWNNTLYYARDTINKKTAAFYVLVADLPKEELSLSGSSFVDYVDGKSSISITDELLNSYTTRTHNGVTKYYYIYRFNKNDEYPIDNSLGFITKFNLRSGSATPSEQSYDCDVNVEQWNRDTYDGNYVPATNQTVTFTVPEGEPLKVGNRAGEDKNPLDIASSTGSFYTNCDPSGNHAVRGHVTIKPNPETGYNVERVQISDINTYNYYPDSNGEIKAHFRTSNVTIKVYYTRPLIRLSATNEGSKGKATVDVYNKTLGETETVLTESTFTNGTFVTRGDNAEVIIRPLTYRDDENEFYYTVASIRIGDSYNNTVTVYSETVGDMQGDGYTIDKMDDGSQYRLTLNNVQKDKYIFIQLVGKEKIYTSNLQVNQQIFYADSDKAVDCSDGYYGSVTVDGSLREDEKPMNFDGNDVDTITFDDKAQIEGSVISGTVLSLRNIVPPEGYIIESVEVVMNGYSAEVTEQNGVYTLNNFAPDSGATVVNVKYGLRVEKTDFTLNYRYYSRKWNADSESNYENNDNIIGEDTQPDKTYTVTVPVSEFDIVDGRITNMNVFTDNEPAVTDLYKNCKWVIDDDHVVYDGNEVTITAEHPAKEFVVKFYKNDGDTNELEKISKVKLNSFAKKNGEFITADETCNGSKFAYWLVKKAGTDKEITKCYSRQFNSRVTENIDVVAYYGEKAKSITLSDASFSREQTSDGNGNITDKLFADFILSYMEESGRLFSESAAAAEGVEVLDGYTSGLVVEFDSRIKLLKEDEPGYKLKDEEKVVFSADDAVDKETIISFVKDEEPTLPDTRTLLNIPVNNESYNNKNRVDTMLSFTNTESVRHAVLRAYYYVIDAEGNVQLTDPVYFYMYDIGNSVASTDDD